MLDFDSIFARLGQQTLLCVGDAMLDEFVYGEVTRVSPEAPAPVLAVERSEVAAGGAGNVARNVAALGARCIFVCVSGEDEAASMLKERIASLPLIEAHLLADNSRPTTRKTRFVSEHYSTHLLRADREDRRPIGTALEDAIIARALAALPRAGAVILSDYAKGVLTPRVVRAIIDAANAARKPIVVDPKSVDVSLYRGATLITPNRKELAEAARRDLDNDESIAAALDAMRAQAESDAVLVTLGDQGMMLRGRDGEALRIPGHKMRVRDVSGAGDSVIAVVAAMLAAQSGYEAAMRAANAAGAVAVSKPGTSTVTLAEMRGRLFPAAALASEEKIVLDWDALDNRLEEWRREGLRIGFTNGCFDLLHPGHIALLTQARAACDRLVIGLNSDQSVSRLKGPGRPVQNEQARSDVLAALESVDLVVVFEQDTPQVLIERVRPKVLVKGSDYKPDEVVGRDAVIAGGGELLLVDILPGYSTTEIVRRSRVATKR